MAPLPRLDDHDSGDFYAAAVYGSIVAAALLAGFHEEHVAARTALLTLLSTMGVFWLAHVWSTIVGERIHQGRHFTIRQAGEIGRAEWPLVEATFVPALALLLGWAGVLADTTALTLALVVCIVQLFAWGFVVGRRAYDRRLHALLTGVVDGALGLVLVGLEIAFIH
jgi:hypothetical protein